jgi:hypothetical protein
MANATILEGEHVSDIQSLALRIKDLSKSVDWWNTAILWSLIFAAIAAIAVVVTTRVALRKARMLADIQSELIQLKDSSLAATLKDKDLKIAELGKTAEDERAARVGLESKVAWRKLDNRTQSDLASHLASFSKEPALVTYNPQDIEAASFASDIAATLHAAKWEVFDALSVLSMREGPMPFGTNPSLDTGVRVWSSADENSRKAATALVEQLSSRGFDAVISPDAQNLLSIHPTPTRVVVSVEHKPEDAQGEYKLSAKKKTSRQ